MEGDPEFPTIRPVPFPNSNGSESKVAVALPGAAGAYHYGSAAAGQSDVEERVCKLNDRLKGLEETRFETAEAATRLDEFRREFAGGALTRLAAERDQLREDAARLATQIADLKNRRGVLQRERSALAAHLTELPARPPGFATTMERLRNCIDEHERHEQAWITTRDEKQAELRGIDQQIGTEEIALSHLNGAMETARGEVAAQLQEQTLFTREQNEIAYRAAACPSEPPVLEAARTRYKTNLARFEERFSQNRLDGQIEEKRVRLNELRATHDQESAGLTSDEIIAATGVPDLVARRREARSPCRSQRRGGGEAFAATGRRRASRAACT
jgi:chromosome segregation ATPase